VAYNTRAKDIRLTPGTTIKIRQLFHLLPVRQKSLEENPTYQVAVTRDIREFLVKISLIWPIVAFELRFEGEMRLGVS
jgi:DNA mismatch repair ATPase MutL